jgi:hypothetical protein
MWGEEEGNGGEANPRSGCAPTQPFTEPPMSRGCIRDVRVETPNSSNSSRQAIMPAYRYEPYRDTMNPRVGRRREIWSRNKKPHIALSIQRYIGIPSASFPKHQYHQGCIGLVVDIGYPEVLGKRCRWLHVRLHDVWLFSRPVCRRAG